MSEFKGTKGKWGIQNEPVQYRTNPNPKEWHGSFDIISGETGIACVHAYTFWNQTFEEAQANAKLIASAPEMLEMLQKAERTLREVYECDTNEIQQLIKKATE
jgi:ribonuclease PH